MTVQIDDAILPTNKVLPWIHTFHKQGVASATAFLHIGYFSPMPGQNPYRVAALDPVPGPRLVIACHVGNSNAGNYIEVLNADSGSVYYGVKQITLSVLTAAANTSGCLETVFVPAGYGIQLRLYNAGGASAYYLTVTFYSS